MFLVTWKIIFGTALYSKKAFFPHVILIFMKLSTYILKLQEIGSLVILL